MQTLTTLRQRLRVFHTRFFAPAYRRLSRAVFTLTILGFLFMLTNPSFGIEENYPITYAFVTMWPKFFFGVYEALFGAISSIVHGGNFFKAIGYFFTNAWESIEIPVKAFLGMF